MGWVGDVRLIRVFLGFFELFNLTKPLSNVGSYNLHGVSWALTATHRDQLLTLCAVLSL